MSKTRPISKGQMIYVSHGEYSDYSVEGIFVCTKEFNPDDEVASYLSDRPEQKNKYRFKEGEYLAFLVNQGFLEQVPAAELYLGDYGDPSEICVWDRGRE